MPDSSPIVVVVEDAPDLRLLLDELLRSEGFEVHAADTGEGGLELVAAHGADLVVLDVVLPGMDGFETCRRIRETSDAYVLMLTSKAEEVDRVVGLTIGADDYLTKPFSPAELVARMRARLRRPRAAGTPAVRQVGNLHLDTGAREVRVDGERVALTRIEYELLAVLTDDPRQVVTRDELLERVWGPGWGGQDHLVDVHVSKLRRKLGDDARDPRYLVTVRGVGYRMGGSAT